MSAEEHIDISLPCTCMSGEAVTSRPHSAKIVKFWPEKNHIKYPFSGIIQYENTPIQIYWKFYNQKRKIFR